MQGLQVPARLDTELIGKQLPALLVSGQCIRGTASAMQREHQLAAECLAPWVELGQVDQLGQQPVVPAKVQAGLVTAGNSVQAPLRQRPRDLQLQQPGVNPGQRLALPQVHSFAEPALGGFPVARRMRGVPSPAHFPEPVHV